MCVLYVCEKDVPELEVLQANGVLNRDGAGIAWLDDKGLVHWRKGIETADELHRLVKNLPLPTLIHQRMRSAGPVCPELTHPFPCTKDASTALEGTARTVLAHNGTLFWEGAFSRAEAAAKKGKARLPGGPWSDTRFLAWSYAHVGTKAIKHFGPGQRIALLGKDGATIVNPELWKFNPKDTGGYWQSSDYACFVDRFTLKNLPEPAGKIGSIGSDQFKLLFR